MNLVKIWVAEPFTGRLRAVWVDLSYLAAIPEIAASNAGR